jgi:hypothetical protein
MPDARIRVQVTEDRKTAAIETAPVGYPCHRIELTLDELDQLINGLGNVRSFMTAGQPSPDLDNEEVSISTAANTTWCIKASPPLGALLAFYHPKFGPVGLTLPTDEITKIISFLTERFILQPTQSAKKH